jgi:hypothetical protein
VFSIVGPRNRRKEIVMNAHEMSAVVRDGVTRAVAVVALSGIALIHLLDVPGKFGETPYIAWMYIALIVGCIGVGGWLIRTGSRKAWTAAAILPLAVLIGFVLSRTTGLPSATGDIGNWNEPLGLASMFVEGALLVLSTSVLAGVVPVPHHTRDYWAVARAASPEFANAN